MIRSYVTVSAQAFGKIAPYFLNRISKMIERRFSYLGFRKLSETQ